jgi:uncharacterized RDD family membrane protein YckC
MYCVTCGAAIPVEAYYCPACGSPTSAGELAARAVEHDVASYGRRMVAWLLDSALTALLPLIVITAAITASQPPEQQGEPGQTGIGFLGWLVLPLYSSLMHRYWHGQTLGKRLLSIRVRSYDGKPELTLGQSLGRSYLRMVLLIGFGIPWLVDALWPLGNRERRSIHDRAANTIVVRSRRSAPETLA